MPTDFDLYTSHYGHLADDPQTAVRGEVYDEDLGQASWINLSEAREWFRFLLPAEGHPAPPSAPAEPAGASHAELNHSASDRTALEVACGSGGMTCCMASETGARCVGVDINARAIETATARARTLDRASDSPQDPAPRVEFRVVDAARPLPFPDASFDAVLCNDSINHLANRLDVLRDWHRVLRPGGRLLFTDPIVVTGQLTNDEIRARSSIGFFLFTPVGHNERLLADAGFTVDGVRDVTGAVASISGRWHAARARRRDSLVTLEGRDAFDAFQRFLDVVHLLSSERRLSRFAYLAKKAAVPAAAAAPAPRRP